MIIKREMCVLGTSSCDNKIVLLKIQRTHLQSKIIWANTIRIMFLFRFGYCNNSIMHSSRCNNFTGFTIKINIDMFYIEKTILRCYFYQFFFIRGLIHGQTLLIVLTIGITKFFQQRIIFF